MAAQPASIVIPTYRREQVLLETLAGLAALAEPAAEVIVVDQTEAHEPSTQAALADLDARGEIRWVRRSPPSIPAAMNAGLALARSPVVLFLDDDIRVEPGLVLAHVRAHASAGEAGAARRLVAGRVIQPWEEGMEWADDGVFRFCGTRPARIKEFMGGNFSVRRDEAMALGGFDENFVRVAYRFEAEFAHRWRSARGEIVFEPEACIHHLKAGGGTRSYGDYLRTARPDHAVGAYYHALRTGRGWSRWQPFVSRPWRAIATRHHLRRPWWIPATLFAEAWGMAWALRLALGGPRLLPAEPTA